MKKTTHYNIKGFTLVELVVIMTIMAILGAVSYNIYTSYKEELYIDREISDVQQYGFLLANVVNKTGDIPLNYCKNTSGGHDSACFQEDPLLDGNEDSICDGTFGTLNSDPDCDNGCVYIDCTETICSGNNIFYDFEEVFSNNIGYNYIISTDTFMDKISYKLCPSKDITDSTVIGKGNETEYGSFNPSFTIFYNNRPVYKYNSNP